MKTSHVLVGVGVLVAAFVAYRAISARRVDSYGSGTEAPVKPMVWNGSAWVPAPPVGSDNTATLWVPPSPPPAPAPGGMSAGDWAAVNAKTAALPPLGTTNLLPVELATLQFFNPPR